MVKARDSLAVGLAPAATLAPVEWRVSDTPVPYDSGLAVMDQRAAAIAAGTSPELAWLIEHPALYTAGTSAEPDGLLAARFPVHVSGRGGQFTYHGPGQRVAYLMLDLRRRGPDVRRYVASLEEWLIRTLATFNVRGERREDRVGVWVRRPDRGRRPRRQDRGHRHPDPALGQPARHRAQCGLRSVAFLRHRAVRRGRAALRRHQPGRSRYPGEHAGSRRGAAARIRKPVRADPHARGRAR